MSITLKDPSVGFDILNAQADPVNEELLAWRTSPVPPASPAYKVPQRAPAYNAVPTTGAPAIGATIQELSDLPLISPPAFGELIPIGTGLTGTTKEERENFRENIRGVELSWLRSDTNNVSNKAVNNLVKSAMVNASVDENNTTYSQRIYSMVDRLTPQGLLSRELSRFDHTQARTEQNEPILASISEQLTTYGKAMQMLEAAMVYISQQSAINNSDDRVSINAELNKLARKGFNLKPEIKEDWSSIELLAQAYDSLGSGSDDNTAAKKYKDALGEIDIPSQVNSLLDNVGWAQASGNFFAPDESGDNESFFTSNETQNDFFVTPLNFDPENTKSSNTLPNGSGITMSSEESSNASNNIDDNTHSDNESEFSDVFPKYKDDDMTGEEALEAFALRMGIPAGMGVTDEYLRGDNTLAEQKDLIILRAKKEGWINNATPTQKAEHKKEFKRMLFISTEVKPYLEASGLPAEQQRDILYDISNKFYTNKYTDEQLKNALEIITRIKKYFNSFDESLPDKDLKNKENMVPKIVDKVIKGELNTEAAYREFLGIQESKEVEEYNSYVDIMFGNNKSSP